VTFIAYSPLGRGFLSGAVRKTEDLQPHDFRRTHPRFQEANIAANRALVDRLDEIARILGATKSQLALAWLLAQPWNVVPIPATRRLEHFQDNLKALELKLAVVDLDAISQAVPPAAVRGARHPADHMKTIDR
jgi:aryl-alcohol dehydrogenase-like predicted oxidoreductase